MTDEKYLFVQDVRNKKNVARSARSKRTHNGKGGSVRLPSDFMTRKEIKNMSGEVKSYKLNDPMSWAEFKALPDDIKIAYIKLIREKFHAFDSAIAEMMGINKVSFSNEIKRLGLGHGTKHGGYRTWAEKDSFYAWRGGVREKAPEEAVAADVCICENEPESVPDPKETVLAIPTSGSMLFNGPADESLKTMSILLGGANVRISIQWELCDNG